MFRDRGVHSLIHRRLDTTPVTLLQGARQVGKSTLVQEIRKKINGSYRTLDDRDVERAARSDPAAFITTSPDHCLILDEVQRVPDLITAIKASVDLDRRPGRFLLTGSADLLWSQQSTETLAGRAGTVDLGPYTQGELQGRADSAVTALFDGDLADRRSELTRQDYVEIATRGGYPLVNEDNLADSGVWLQDYLVRIQRDVAERGRQRRVEEIPELLRVLAGRQTQEFNASSVAGDLDLKVDSVRNYVRLLEGHYLVHLIPAFAAAPLKHGVKRPKVLLNDTGLAASLLGLTTQRALSDSGGQIVGALVEAFVATEVIRQLSWAPLAAGYRVSHYRQTGGPEIDLIVEDSAGRVVAIEVKAQASPPVVAPQGFRSLQDAVGDRFIAGLVLYAGAETVPLGDRVRAAPIDILWSTGAPLAMSSDDAGPGAPSPSLVGDAQVFWSYAHADDQREDGRITRLARAVRDEYQFLTGGEQLELFIDEDIQWGERWRSRIDTALDRTSLFVAVLTPTYLRRPECQRELETFVGLADRAGSGRLLLPLRYGPITAEDPDPVITRLVEQAQAHQWIDLEQLRFEEETSAPWRQMVNQLAQRLVDAARTAPTSDVPPSAATSEPFDEGSDLVELTAKINELEPALDELLSTFTHVAEILSSTMDLPPGLAPDRQSRLLRTAAHRAAEALREPLDDMDKAVERVSTLLDGFDQLLAFVLEVPREYSRDLLIEVRDGFDVPETGFEEINQIQPTLRMLGGMSRELRPAMGRIERGLRLISGMEVRLRDWQAAAARALAE